MARGYRNVDDAEGCELLQVFNQGERLVFMAGLAVGEAPDELVDFRVQISDSW